MKKKPIHYVDNVKFYEALCRYKQAIKEHREKTGDQTSRPKNRDYEYIGECLLKIATKLSTAGNFVKYTWRDEMIQDAVMDCIKYLENFDEEKYKNPFAYFTQLCWYANIRRIAAEKKQKTIKGRLILNSGVLDSFDLSTQQMGDDAEYGAQYTDYLRSFLENSVPADEDPEAPKQPKRTTRAYQAKMKELEEAEKQLEAQLLGKTEDDDFDEDEDLPNSEYDDLFHGDEN